MIKLNPNERLLIESWINHYRIIGPGLVWLKPWQRLRARIYIGPNAVSVDCNQVRTREDIPVRASIKVIYRINPELFSETILSGIPVLNEGGWKSIVEWRSEAFLRRFIARYEWRALKEESIQENLEQQLNRSLVSHLSRVGIEVLTVNLVKIELGGTLQQTITQAEQDIIEADGRAKVLKRYFEIFGENLAQVIPYIKEWEILNLLHKNDNLQPLLMAHTLSNGPMETNALRPAVQIIHNGNETKENNLNGRSARRATSADITSPPVAN